MRRISVKKMAKPLALASLFLVACNSDQLPKDASLSISPKGRDFLISAPAPGETVNCIPDGAHQDVPLLITLKDGGGSPLGGSKVSIFADFTGQGFSGISVLKLYYDKNGNGQIDSENELVSGSKDAMFSVNTAKYTGSVLLTLRMNLTCPYKGQVFAFSGAASGLAEINVAYREEATENPQQLSTDTAAQNLSIVDVIRRDLDVQGELESVAGGSWTAFVPAYSQANGGTDSLADVALVAGRFTPQDLRGLVGSDLELLQGGVHRVSINSDNNSILLGGIRIVGTEQVGANGILNLLAGELP